jgi:hypothetical protein
MTEYNRDQILTALKKIGAKSVTVQYCGSGDSGQIEDVEIVTETSIDVMECSVTVTEKRGRLVPDVGWRESEVEVNTNIEDAIMEFCYERLSELREGWELNEGSQGTFNFDVRNGKINLIHHQNIMTTETSKKEI